MANERQEPKYEDVRKDMLNNMDNNAFLFYASLMNKDNGQEGQQNALTGALINFRDKMGLEGILAVLEGKAEESIKAGRGLGGNFDVYEQVQMGAINFQQSYWALKPADIAAYIKDATGAEIEVRGNAPIGETKKKMGAKKKLSEEEKAYFGYINNQIIYAVMAKCSKEVYKERAAKDTEAFSEAFPKKKD